MKQGKNIDNEALLCPHCKTGKTDYELDKTSVFCSYIACLHDGECSMYVSLLECKPCDIADRATQCTKTRSDPHE